MADARTAAQSDGEVIDPGDSLPAMRVGEWSVRKHELIGKYAEASRKARGRFSSRCYIDLFCGPGRVFVEKAGHFADGSALTAMSRTAGREGAFTDFIIGDLNESSVDACRRRLEAAGVRVNALAGPAEETVDRALALAPQSGLHLALLDPFNLANLRFDVIRKLAARRHVDIIVHFSAIDLKRNLELDWRAESSRFQAVAPGWREAISLPELAKRNGPYAFIEYWRGLVRELGLTVAEEAPDFTNSNNGLLYWLFMLYRHPLAGKIWDSFRAPGSTRSLW